MGNDVSTEEKQEKQILRSPNTGQASNLYWACREGDLNKVKEILATTEFNDLNRLEPNGSTALHAAAFFGHVDIVRLLLNERGVMRHRKNRHGLTAYEEAATDEIRQLFHRPNNNRFCNNSIGDNETLFNFDDDQQSAEDENSDKYQDNWVEGMANELDVKTFKSSIRILRTMSSSPVLRAIVKRALQDRNDFNDFYNEEKAIIKLQKLLDEYVTSNDSQYEKACKLLSKYTQTTKPEHLLHLYSLETPFYRSLDVKNEGSLRLLLYIRLKSLKTRAFNGRTYRGLTMTRSGLKAYQWALQKTGTIIILNTFCSTSVDEAVAQRFISPSSDIQLKVLMIFDFPEPCDTAIQLYALSAGVPCISEFDDEREVLILPGTLFNVVNIVNDELNGQYKIYLQNVLPKLDLVALWTVWRKNRAPDS